MNANELLAYNQGYNAGLKAGIDLNTEPMLRQQQAEIEALKNANRFIQNFAEEQHQRAVALEMRELTNAEILWLADEYSDEENLVADCVGFARAVLRKAKEWLI